MGNDKKTKRNSNRIFAFITYLIALICLLLGLFLPYNFETPVDAMIGLQIPAAFDNVYKIGEGMQTLLKTPAFDGAFSFPLTFGEFTFDLGAALLVLYSVVAVATVIALIPVAASTFGGKKKKAKKAVDEEAYYEEPVKENKNVALRAASFIEAFAIMVLSLFVFFYLITLEDITKFNYAILAAFGGTLLMLIVQALFYKGGSGLMKILLALFSTLSVLLFFDITRIIPPLADVLKDFDLINLFTQDGTGATVLAVIIPPIVGIPVSFEGMEITMVILYVCIMVYGYLAVVNFVLDLMGLGKKTTKFMLVLNLIRYFLEFAAIAVVLIMTFVIEGLTFGYLSIILLALAALAFIFNIFRLVAYPRKNAKKSKKYVPEKTKNTERKESKKQPKPEKVKEEPVVVAKESKQSEQKVYNPVIYNGVTDDFINTLANEQKIEFSKVFLERKSGPLPQIPNYEVGEKNEKFFSSIFIHYSKVRDLISDELMNKIYVRANVM